jgi:phage baseplate assembly protein W
MSIDPKAFLGVGWAYPVQPNTAHTDAALAVYEDDVRDAVRIILETDRGERVMRPDFGAGLRDFLFEPVNQTTLALIQHRVEEALITWEPRIRIEEITLQLSDSARTRIDIKIEYVVRATNTFYNLVYPFYLQEGER